ncbi:Hypothetical protein SRAE_2000046300 [Strongyloides ratti]|uniref:Proteinase inhibitor I25, cystatin domain-containing protein n=1 Tax=Strongyloides ratti TaxID=34506 RepID=A0A090L7T2_STRRB|nr:Hypothetical protein SRAE_2000046300 [Strongyloides ratti]CEF65787.2 Hypothetical protein SRAE_2000046300 [Strongyloides ratti]
MNLYQTFLFIIIFTLLITQTFNIPHTPLKRMIVNNLAEEAVKQYNKEYNDDVSFVYIMRSKYENFGIPHYILKIKAHLNHCKRRGNCWRLLDASIYGNPEGPKENLDIQVKILN